MKKNTTYILVGILVILIAGFIIQKRNRESENLVIIQDRRIVLFDDIETVNKIIVRNKETEVIMTKSGGKWRTDEGYNVYKFNIEELLNNAKDANIHAVISYSLETAADFNLDEDNTYEYIFQNGDEDLGSFKIAQGDLGQGYIERGGDDKIVSILNPNYIFFQYEWRDRVVEDTVASRHITEVIIKKGERFTTLTKKQEEDEEGLQEDVWYVNDRKADQEKVKQYISGLPTATASGFPEVDDEFESSGTTVKIKTKNDSFLITIGEEKDDEQTFIKNSRGLIYFVNTKNTLPKFVISQRDVL